MGEAPVAAWSAALDEIESTLRDADALAEATVEHTTVPAGAGAGAGSPNGVATAASPWVPPAGLGPLPAELAPRAAGIAAALAAVRDRVDASRAAVAAELVDTARGAHRRAAATDEPPTPRLVDHSA